MDDFIAASLQLEVLGIRMQDWYRFLRMHSDQTDPDAVSMRLERDLRRHVDQKSVHLATRAAAAVRELADLLGQS